MTFPTMRVVKIKSIFEGDDEISFQESFKTQQDFVTVCNYVSSVFCFVLFFFLNQSWLEITN